MLYTGLASKVNIPYQLPDFNKNFYNAFDEIGKRYGPLRQTLCEKLYQSQKNAFNSKNYGISDNCYFWTRNPLKKLALLLKVSIRTIQRAIKDLKECGLIITSQFKENLKNYKTGRLMTDLYIAFVPDKLLEMANICVEKINALVGTQPVDNSTNNVQEFLPYDDKMSTSYKEDNLPIKQDTINRFDHIVDNFKKLPTTLQTTTTKIINSILGKEKNMPYEGWKEDRQRLVDLWNNKFSDESRAFVTPNAEFNNLLLTAFKKLDKDIEKYIKYLDQLKLYGDKTLYSSIFKGLTPFVMDKVQMERKRPLKAMYRILNENATYNRIEEPIKPVATQSFDEAVTGLNDADGDLADILKRFANTIITKG